MFKNNHNDPFDGPLSKTVPLSQYCS